MRSERTVMASVMMEQLKSRVKVGRHKELWKILPPPEVRDVKIDVAQTNSEALAASFALPTFRKVRERWGTHLRRGASKIKSLGDPATLNFDGTSKSTPGLPVLIDRAWRR